MLHASCADEQIVTKKYIEKQGKVLERQGTTLPEERILEGQEPKQPQQHYLKSYAESVLASVNEVSPAKSAASRIFKDMQLDLQQISNNFKDEMKVALGEKAAIESEITNMVSDPKVARWWRVFRSGVRLATSRAKKCKQDRIYGESLFSV